MHGFKHLFNQIRSKWVGKGINTEMYNVLVFAQKGMAIIPDLNNSMNKSV